MTRSMSSSAVSEFFRTLPETLQQPVALAMLGSAGVHILLFATLPAFTTSTQPKQDAEVRRVQVIAPPRSNAPQAATSRLGLPPVPNTPNSKIQVPSATQTTPPFPNPLYTIPDLTQVPPPPAQSQQSDLDLIRKYLAGERPATVRIPKTQPKTQSSPKSSPSPSPASPGGLAPSDPSKIATGSTQPPNNSTQNPPVQSAPLPTAPIDPAAISYNSQGTTNEDQQQQLIAFSSTWSQLGITGIVNKRPPDQKVEELPYPLPFLINNYQPKPAVIAVLVGLDDKPLPNTEPRLIRSTGYPILNNKAIEIVKARSQQPNAYQEKEKTNKTRLYIYELQFKPPTNPTATQPTKQN